MKAIQGKEALSKFCESVLAKTAKIRGLIQDLKKNYRDCPMAKKPLSDNNFWFDRPAFSPVMYLAPSSPQPVMTNVLRSVTALEQDLVTMDSEYNKLSDLMARGEQSEFNAAFLGYHSI